MTDWRGFARRIAYWTLPPGIQAITRSRLNRRSVNVFTPEEQAVLQRNRGLRNRHAGERCFILATGPSIRDQDLTPLQKECCFATSEFYKHRHYKLIRPAYYCTAPFHPPFTEEDARRRLEEMKQQCKNEIFFFGLSDREMLIRSEFVANRERVYYLDFFGGRPWPPNVDLTCRLPGPQSVALMAIWVAIYMGFSEIYLIGCDHDTLWKWDGSPHHVPEHFYDGLPTIGCEPFDIEENLRTFLRLREQYRWVNQIALHNDIRIFNANPRSYIDTFPKVLLDALFN